ncbi:helix-turn-helix transcriptional regulator [Gimesia maris]|uniref:helix-turn-helix transcriptional regulator n=1 Tax=Gimesia maris TaxID=122 RepID=UPI003A8F5B2B
MTPGDRIRRNLEEKGWTQSDLAKILDRPLPTINEIITGKKTITPETAIGLSDALGGSPSEWLAIEAEYRLSLLDAEDYSVRQRSKLFEYAPIKDMEKRGWIKKSASAFELESELKLFFRVDSLTKKPELSVSTRRSLSVDDEMNPSQKAWCIRARNLALSLDIPTFSDARFEKGMRNLKKLTTSPDVAKLVPRILTEMGIRFVIVEQLPRTRIDGAAFWIDRDKPVIALSLRYDRIDSFWHTLGHELSHIRHKDDLKVDADIVGKSRPSPVEQSSIERRADSEAAAAWIDQEELMSFIDRIGPLYSLSRINQFANKMKVHPGIIVGQLQYRGEIGYQACRETLVKVRNMITSEALTDGWGHFLD